MPSARARSIGGFDHRDLLAPEQPAFAGMRIEAGDGDARLGHAQPARGIGGEADGAQLAGQRQQAGHGGERHVDRRQHDAQLVVEQHHAHVRAPGQFGQDFGMAGMGDAGRVQRLLVQGRGDQCAHPPLLRQSRAQQHGLVRGAACPRIEPAGRQIVGQGRAGLHDLDDAGGEPRLLRAVDRENGEVQRCRGTEQRGGVAHHDAGRQALGRREQPGADLRPDSGRVAHADRDRCHGRTG